MTVSVELELGKEFNRIEIHLAVFNPSFLCFFLHETRSNFVIVFSKKNYKSYKKMGQQSKVFLNRTLVV